MQGGLLVLVRSPPEPAVTCLVIQLVMKLLQQEERQGLLDLLVRQVLAGQARPAEQRVLLVQVRSEEYRLLED